MRPRERISITFGAGALLAAVLVVGGVLRWTQGLVALLIAVALAVQLPGRRRLERLSPLLAVLAAAIVVTAIQLLPLPDALLGALSPTGHGLRVDGAAIAGTSPWMSLSLDPPATLRELAFFVILFGAAVLALRFAASERGRFQLLAGVAITCGLAAAVTGVHTLVNADSLYALYEPQFAKGTPVFGPLLNPNHLGGLMAIGTVLSLGLAFYNRQAAQLRVVWVVTGIACTVVGAASLSRGAMIALISGVIVTSVVLVVSRVGASRLTHQRLRNDLPIALVIVSGLAVAMYFSAGSTFQQLDATSMAELDRPTSKYEAWRSSLTLVREAPWVGIGRGATEATLTRVHPGSALATFADLENAYLTAVVEWGIPGALLIGLGVAWCIAMALRTWRDGPLAAAALGALAAILLQSGVDFGIELLGIALPVTIIAATVMAVPLRVGATTATKTRIGRGALIAVVVAAAAVLLSPVTRDLREDHARITGDDGARRAAIVATIERHPVDYVGFGEAAAHATRTGDPNAVRYLNHALMLHPTHPGLHRLAARLLVRLKRHPQAALEYALALRAEPVPRRMLDEIVRELPSAELAAAAIPVDYPKIDVILHALADLERPDIAIAWLARVARREPPDLRVIDRLYELAIKHADLDAAKAAAVQRREVSNTTTSRLMHAKVLFARAEHDALLAELADIASWTGRTDEKAEAWFMVCDIHIARRDWNAALTCLHRLDASGTLTASRSGVIKRTQRINEQRAAEAKQKAIEELERSLAHPR